MTSKIALDRVKSISALSAHSAVKRSVFDPVNPFPAMGFPIDELNRLALDRVKFLSALSVHSVVKGLNNLRLGMLPWYLNTFKH